MKHGKNPTVRQRKIIAVNGLNAENWLVSKDFPDRLELIHRHTGNGRVARKRR